MTSLGTIQRRLFRKARTARIVGWSWFGCISGVLVLSSVAPERCWISGCERRWAAFSYLHGGDFSVQCHKVHEAVAGQARLWSYAGFVEKSLKVQGATDLLDTEEALNNVMLHGCWKCQTTVLHYRGGAVPASGGVAYSYGAETG